MRALERSRERRRWWWQLVLPLVVLGVAGLPLLAAAEAPVLLGIYPGPLGAEEIQEIETWLGSGRRFALAAGFMVLESSASDARVRLEGLWNHGFVPFFNFHTDRTSADVASGAIDTQIRALATEFARWAKGGGGKRAFLAPFPEMNGAWTGYHTPDKAVFIAAYRRVWSIFQAALVTEGVTHKAINWVFPPNGGAEPGLEFEKYYPGHEYVDIVAVSAYNYGGCPPVAPWFIWDTFETGFKPYLDRMRAMATGKPLFLSQTGTLDRPAHGIGDKDEWFRDTFAKLAAYPRFRGLVYFNLPVDGPSHNLPNCPIADFRLHVPGTTMWQGAKDAVNAPANHFGYWAPTSPEMANIAFASIPPHTFDDVAPVHPLAAEDGEIDLSPWIETLYASGITGGCSSDPLLFCPTSPVTRAQMAVFLLKGIHGAAYVPPAATGAFTDVPVAGPSAHPFANWIEQLAREGITGGCAVSPARYCPDTVVTRGEMAVFLLRAKHGGGYDPPPATGGDFGDIPASHLLAKWIEQLAAEGITGGCGGGFYCPNAGVTREQMAVFLVRTFGL